MNHIVLKDGAALTLLPDGCWSFRRNGEHIRYLSHFESEFIRAAQVQAGADMPCMHCDGSGESSVLDSGGPDAFEVPCNCPRCNGSGSMQTAYATMSSELSRLHLEAAQLRFFRHYAMQYGWRAGQKSADESAPTAPAEPSERLLEGQAQHLIGALMATGMLSKEMPARRVYLVATGEVHDGQETYTRHDDAPPPLCDAECLFSAPTAPAEPSNETASLSGIHLREQIEAKTVGLRKMIRKEAGPAAAAPQAEPQPLTDEQIKRGWHQRSLHPHVDVRFTEGVRYAERAHGIGTAPKGDAP